MNLRWLDLAILATFIVLLCGTVLAGDLVQAQDLGTQDLTPTLDKNSTLKPIQDVANSTFNQKTYDAKTSTATIKDMLGLQTYGTITLLTPHNVSVGLGYQKVAEFQINSQVDYTNFLNSMYFYDIKNNNTPIKRSFDLREAIQFTDYKYTYKEDCTGKDLDKNGYPKCLMVIDTNTPFINTRYDLFKDTTFGKTAKNISIWTDVEPNDHIEWVPDIYGVTIKEWAVWDANLNNGLVVYYNFNEGSGTKYIDSNGFDNNATAGAGSLQWGTAKIGTYSSNYDKTNYANYTLNTDAYTEKSFGMWVYGSDWNTTDRRIINSTEDGSYGYFRIATGDSASANKGKIACDFGTGATSAQQWSSIMDYNKWYYVVCTSKSGGKVKMYVNGTDVNATGATLSGYGNAGSTTNLGAGNTGNNPYWGRIDEYAFWNRQLTQQDVNYLYNSGLGLTYCGSGTWNPGCGSSNQTFNVYKAGTSTGLTGITADWNDNTYDVTGQNSPYIQGVLPGTYLINFYRTGFDNNVGNVITVNGSDNNYTIYMNQQDNTPPVTTMAYTIPDGNIDATITLTCTDNNVGCASTSFEYDTNGTWFDYNSLNKPKFTGLAHHTIDYNSTDNLGNVETTKVSDLNMPIYLTIKFPLDQQFSTNINNNFNIQTAGTTTTYYSNLSTDKNIYLNYGINNITISDVNGLYSPNTYTKNYYSDSNNGTTDTLQPYMLLKANTPLSYIRSQSLTTLLAVPGVTIKVYTLINGVLTLATSLTTDSSGSAQLAMIANQSYTWYIYYNGSLVSTQTIVGPSASGTTFYINLNDITNPIVNVANGLIDTNFSPNISVLHKYDSNLIQTTYLYGNTPLSISSITTTVTNFYSDKNTVIYSNTVTQPTLPYTNTIPINYLTNTLNGVTYDANGYFIVQVITNTAQGSVYMYMTYKPVNGLNFIQVISFDIRPMVGCSATNNGLIPCAPLLLTALFISIVIATITTISMGYGSMTTIGGLFLFLMGIFTYISWVPYIIFGLMFAGVVGLMIAEGGRRI